MDIKQLEVFNTIYKHKNFSNAAKELFISQPTVSAHIKSLEESLGLQLFNRKNKAMGNLTDAGKILYQYSSQILSLVREAEESLADYKKGYSGSLSIVTSHSFCYWVLPEILERFKKKFPFVDIALHTEFTPKMIDMIYNREVHFAIARTSSPHFNDNELNSILIGHDPAVFVVSSQHPLAYMERVTIEDVLKEQFILYGKKSSFWPQVNNVFASMGFEIKTNMEMNDINAAKKMIEINMGISVLPKISVQSELKNGQLKTITVEDFPPIMRYSNLIYRKDLIVTGPLENFIKFIQNTKPFPIGLE